MSHPPIAILADDLTGANDTGAQFSRVGASVLVLVSLERLPTRLDAPWGALVLNTGSRNLAPGEARGRVTSACGFLRRLGIPLVYKKIDSTLRGNVIPELRALFEQGIPSAFLAPAFPLNGRTVEQGVLRVGGVPVHETEAARDGLSPVKSGNIPDMLAEDFPSAVGAIGLDTVRNGAGALREAIGAQARAGHRIIVCDAQTQPDLALWTEAVRPSLPGPVLVGSAGWARELAAALVPAGTPQPRGVPCAGVLIVAGSRSVVTAAQVRRLHEQTKLAETALDPRSVDGAWSSARAAELGAAACDALQRNESPRHGQAAGIRLVTLGADDGSGPERFHERSPRLNQALGETIRTALARWPGLGLVLTGGDVAAAAIDALRAEGIELGAEVLPGIPMGRLSGGAASGVRLVTKAGAFGEPDALWLAARALLEG